MTEASFRPSEEQLHAFVDGFLAEPERSVVERFLADNPGEALRLELPGEGGAPAEALELPLEGARNARLDPDL